MTSHNPHRKTRKATEHGIALLAVLWLVAAMSLMLGSLQRVVRGEVLIAGQARKSVIGNGVADAAIRLTLQKLAAEKNKPVKSIQTQTVTVFDNEVRVGITPLNGFVDLNKAPISLLSDTFEYGGGVSREQAQSLANSVLAARDRKNADGEPVRLHAVEDLLGLADFDYKLYAKIKNYATAEINGSGLINPLAASLDTLAVLTKGDLSRARQLLESRLLNPESLDTTTLTATHIEMAPTSYLVISATAVTPDSTSVMRTWRVDMSTSAFGLPWRVLGIDQGLVIPSAPR